MPNFLKLDFGRKEKISHLVQTGQTEQTEQTEQIKGRIEDRADTWERQKDGHDKSGGGNRGGNIQNDINYRIDGETGTEVGTSTKEDEGDMEIRKSDNQMYIKSPVVQISHENQPGETQRKRMRPPPESVITVHNISTVDIVPNPNQPRKDFDERLLYGLAQSIRDYGIIQPLTVRRLLTVDESCPPVYELIAGERRLRAAKLLDLETVPCIIIDADRQSSAEIAIIENLQREDLNFFEQARAIEKLIEMFSYSQEQIARKLSVSQSYIANKLRILRLTSEERELILESGLTERHARAFIRVPDAEERKKVILTVINRVMNVSMTEKYIDRVLLMCERERKNLNRQKRLMILKDVRLFLNSIDKAVDIVTQSGINIHSEKMDKGEYIEVILKVPKFR